MLGGEEWSPPLAPQRQAIGAILVVGGGAFFLAALFRLGSALTPPSVPQGRRPAGADGSFRARSPSNLQRWLNASVGIALAVSGWLTYVYVAALFVLFDVKSRQEER